MITITDYENYKSSFFIIELIPMVEAADVETDIFDKLK